MSLLQPDLATMRAGGYALLFLGSLLEAVPFLGSFVPGQLMVILAGVLASTGVLNVQLVILVALVGNILGQVAGYASGRFVGRPILDAVAPRFRVSEGEVHRTERLFRKYGPLAVFFGQFSFLTRGVVNLFAGMSRMPGRVYWPVSIAAAVIWSLGYVLLGFVFGTAYQRVKATFGIAALLLSLLIGAAWAWWGIRRLRRAAREEGDAMPGPDNR